MLLLVMSAERDPPLLLAWYPYCEDETIGMPKWAQSLLREHFTIVWLKDILSSPDSRRHVQVAFGTSVDGCIPTVQDHLDWFPNLKVVFTFSVGYDHVKVSRLRARGIRVCASGAFRDPTAEFGMTLLLALSRNLIQKAGEVRRGVECEGSMEDPAPGLTGATLGMVGMGRIGTVIAQAARVLSARVLYHNRNARPASKDQEDGFEYSPSLDELLRRSDYIIITCPLTPETRAMIGPEQFRLMKSSAALINIARAEVIDQEALLASLTSGGLRAAALDLTSPPILPTDHPLLHLPNVIVTNHCAYLTERALRRTYQDVVDNALDGLAGRPMANEIF